MGNTILNELVLKSFFKISGNSSITMHDLMHDLGRSFRGECFCLEGPDVSIVPPGILQLSISYRNSLTPNILETLSKSHPSLHTCILVNQNTFSTKQIIFKNLDCLRALDLSHTKMNNLPLSIGKCKHLKYLNLSATKLAHLPDTICTLTKLQTLILRQCDRLTHLPDRIGQLINLRHLDLTWCDELTHLPVGISQMTNLRHLNLYGCDKLTQLPSGMGKLVYLRALREFTVGRESGHRITELQGLNHLGGSLKIMGLEHVRDASEAREAVLKEKKNMSSLSLIWGEEATTDEAEGVLEALQPPQSLNGTLVIKGYGGSVFAASWIKLLENLDTVDFKDCVKLERLPPLGQLPLLRNLFIEGMKSIKCIGTDFYGGDGCTDSNSGSERRRIFPSIETLVFDNMPMLEFSVDDFQNLISLKYLRVCNLPRVTSLPNLQNLRVLEKLVVSGCEQLTSLPEDFQHLRSLQYLWIRECPNLKTLPPGLQNLTSLRWLEIRRCHRDLHLRCDKDKGEYWPSISHIQGIDIWPPEQS